MTDINVPSPKRATSYVWRLFMLIPAIALFGYGYWRHTQAPAGGTVTSIRATSKPGISGQVQDAYAGVMPTTADLYLVIHRDEGEPIKLQPFDDTPLGNGLTWPLDAPLSQDDIARVEVWDYNTIVKDKALDRIEFGDNAWTRDGQTFSIMLIGQHAEKPRWPLPLASVGAVLGAAVVLRFVWDQAL